MNGNAQDLMCGAPGEVTEQQLREVHIKVRQQYCLADRLKKDNNIVQQRG